MGGSPPRLPPAVCCIPCPCSRSQHFLHFMSLLINLDTIHLAFVAVLLGLSEGLCLKLNGLVALKEHQGRFRGSSIRPCINVHHAQPPFLWKIKNSFLDHKNEAGESQSGTNTD